MVSLCKMIRILLLPVLLFALSMACSAQTFQYSRGWTNGKRAIAGTHYHRMGSVIPTEDDGLHEFYEIQESERRLEKCLLQLQSVLRNPLFLTHIGTPLALNSNLPTNNRNLINNDNNNGNSNNNNINNNNRNNPYANSHNHQSNELFEELSAIDSNDYGKH